MRVFVNGISVPNRRKELSEYITDDGTYLPKSILHEDLDGGMLQFVKETLQTTVNGKAISVIDKILTLQRWGEFSNTWQFSEKDRNVSLPFIVAGLSPKAWIFIGTIFPTFINFDKNYIIQFLILGITYITLDFIRFHYISLDFIRFNYI